MFGKLPDISNVLRCGAILRVESGLTGLREAGKRAELALLMNEFGHEPGPAGLVGRAQAGAGVPVEIFMKPVALGIPSRVERAFGRARERCVTVFIARPETDQAVRQLVCHL